MNYIFDIGNVLINFKPKIFLSELFSDQSIAEKIRETIFESPEWVMLDKGIITEEEASNIFSARESDFQQYIQQTMEQLHEMLTPISETIELLPQIRESGHRLYYLSNYHKNLSRYIQNKYQFFNQFDGGVFSCDVHMIKPSPEIYYCLLNEFGLSPQDCIFFDDTAENLATAENIGIKGVLFTGANDIMRCLENTTV